MALQTINLGTYANDGTGDDLRTAFQKVNSNLVELFDSLYGAHVGVNPPAGQGIQQGELWWSNETGLLYVRYGSAWVEASPPPPAISYDISAETVLGGANIKLNGSDLSVDNIKFASSTNITVTRTNANTITLSSESYTGNLFGDTTGTHTGPVVGDVTGNTTGTHTGPVTGNVTGNLTGNSSGTHTGSVIGNVTGNADTVTNGVYTTSSINALADVDTVTTAPTSGQALAWNGSSWTPQTIVAGVSKIIAGTNVTISPTNGLGQVTINSTGITDVFDLGAFQQNFSNPLSYLLDQVGIDFGSFISPATFTIDGGTF